MTRPPRTPELAANAQHLNVALMATDDLELLKDILAAEQARPGGARAGYLKRIRHRIGAVASKKALEELDGRS